MSAEIGNVTAGIFRKLMGSLIESTLMYGAEIWGCSRHLEAIEQVQLRALRMLFMPCNVGHGIAPLDLIDISI